MEVFQKGFQMLLSPRLTSLTVMALLLVECILVPFVVWKIPYTEIDWKAYMDEVKGFLNNGTTDYYQLKGDTGPLVYPAGFVYIYSILYKVTGEDVGIGQILFALLYLVNLVLVLKIYKTVANVVNFPIILLPFLCLTAYRIHSIFILRLFNDGVAVTILHIALLFMMNDQWNIGCAIYSLAVSVKMNIILYSPGLGILLLRRFGIRGTIEKILLCAIIQVIIGSPFLLTYPVAYIVRSFDISRVFLYEWTVNWRFLSEEWFLSRVFHSSLLCGHVVLLCLFAGIKWMPQLGTVKDMLQWKRNGIIAPQEVLYIMFTSNFIGICFARSLHYQFYVWYFYSLPLLVHWTGLHTFIGIGLLLSLEYSWNVFPSTVISSLLLHAVHVIILICLLLNNNNNNNGRTKRIQKLS